MKNFLFYATVLASVLFTSEAVSDPQYGGTLVFGRGGDSVSLDPAAVSDGESLNVTDHIFDNLVTFKEGTTEIIPEVAKSWEVSKNGLQYTFTLHENIKFHDGSELDPDAVKFSFERQILKSHPAYKWGGPYTYANYLKLPELIKSIATKGENQVVFNLSRREASFLAMLGMQSFGIISKAAITKHKKEFAQNPVGSGPFVFKSWKKNQLIILETDKKYWNKRAFVDRLIFRSIPDNSTRLFELMAGKIHVMDNPNPDDVKVLEDRMGKKVQIRKKPGMNVGYLALNNNKKPLDNINIRKAIAHAVNKKGIIEAVYSGNAEIAHNPMPPTLWGHSDSVKKYDFDLEKAKSFVEKSGLKTPIKLNLYAMPVPRPYMPDGRKVAEAIQGDLAKIGINLEIVSYEWGTYLEKTDNGHHDMALLGWTADIGDPDNFLYVLLDKDNAEIPASNISFYKNEMVHKYLMTAKSIGDQNKRAELYIKAQNQIAEDVPMIPIAHSIDVVPMLQSVNGFIIDPTGRRRFKNVWIAGKDKS